MIERLRGVNPSEEMFRMTRHAAGWIPQAGWEPHRAELLDDFHACKIARREDIRDHFIPNFFFGCEADDPSVSWALGGQLPLGARLNAMFGSDIGHWDVPDITGVLAEAHELLEHGYVTPEGFRDFSFAAAVRLHGGANPRFFEGTIVQSEARAVLQADADV
jgi:hypothetical protein